MSDKKEISENENIDAAESKLNGDNEVDDEVVDKSESDESIGTPSYEELFDKNEELEKLLLRSNADLDNALKRTLVEVEKAHKYGTERLLLELLPIIDNLENGFAFSLCLSRIAKISRFGNFGKALSLPMHP